MDTLFQDQSSSFNGFEYEYNFEPLSVNPLTRRDLNGNGCQYEGEFIGSDVPSLSKESSQPVNLSPCEEESQVESDYFDGVFKYIQEMLMEEEELEDRPCMLQECLALQAAEKIFDKVLHEDPSNSYCRSPTPAFVGQYFDNPTDNFVNIWNDDHVVNFQAFECNFQPFNPVDASNSCNVFYELVNPPVSSHFPSSKPSMASENQTACQFGVGGLDSNFLQNKNSGDQILGLDEIASRLVVGQGRNSEGETSNGRKTNRSREETNNDHNEDQRSSKQFSGYTEEIETSEVYDDVLLCPDRNPNFYGESPANCCGETTEKEGTNMKPHFQPQKPKRGRPRAGEKRSSIREVVDLRDLLTRCAHAVASYDNGNAQELLKKIRQHSSPHGGATERLAHYFANGLEARVTGMGTALYTTLATRRASDILKAYQTYLTICPFQRMSNIFANKSIGILTGSTTRVHIIDFGILYGFQWPCIIHGLSLRPGGPPKLRITGIDFPQPGFRPAERIEETGRRLTSFCKRFDVPFEFNAIAKRWDAIRLEELKIEEDEMVVVNCLFRLRNAADETVEGERSPRDAVMNLIKKINPDLFVHGILNAGYNAPFFATRFKEALHHFSSIFDMFEATLPPEDQKRFMFEKEVLGRDIMNVIACEGTERVDRPDTYKQWQVRNQRAGFRQLPLNHKIMKEIRVKVKSCYHKEFLVDEDSNWMLQGWKGRIIYAISLWKPAHK